MTVYNLPGLHSVETAKRIQQKMNGKTYMSFMVQYGGYGKMNQSVSVCTNYEATEQELADMFISVMVGEM
jgi:hypothetical protein